jgi:hypothetical protein
MQRERKYPCASGGACPNVMFVRAAVLGILAGCAAHHEETARVTVAPVSAASVAPIVGVLAQPTRVEPPAKEATICDIDPSACDKSACGAKSSCSGKASCAGHP